MHHPVHANSSAPALLSSGSFSRATSRRSKPMLSAPYISRTARKPRLRYVTATASNLAHG